MYMHITRESCYSFIVSAVHTTMIMCAYTLVFVGHHLATKVFIGKKLASYQGVWVIIG